MANKVLLKKSSTVAKVPVVGDLDYGEIALNYADGKLYFKNSTNVVQPLGISYTKVIANTTAKINQGYIANTAAGSFTITLPASPQTGNYVIIVDDASFDTNPLYIARNGEPIVGVYENLTLNIAGVSVTLLYDGGQWNVYTQVGATGGTGAGTEETIHNYNSFASSLVPSLNNTYRLGNTSYGWTSLYYGDGTIQSTASNADGSSITNSSGTITAQAGGLAGNTLNSGVVYSSLTTLGSQVQPIQWTTSGVNSPTFTSSSVGTKLILYPAIASNQADYAIGIDSATIWNSVPVNSSDFYFKWYGGTTNVATLTGAGALTLAGTLTISSNKVLTLGGSFTTSGAHATTLTTTGTTGVTLPTTGTLATLAGSETFTNKTLTSPAVTTSLTTGSTTFALVNTTATTVNFAGAATTLSIGAATGTATINNANVVITGNLTVNGTTTTVNSTTITVDDKNIELGSVASPDNTTADGGGITLKGATDKTLNWVNATAAWTSSEDFNLLTGKVYEINGTTVLSATTLGSGVTGSSLTSVGTIGTGVWNGTVVAGQYGGTGVNNSGKTITIGGNFTHTGAHTLGLTTSANTSVTLPTTGTLATLAGTETLTNKTITTPVITVALGSITVSGLTNTSYFLPSYSNSIAAAPFSGQIWHDLLAFGTVWGLPTYETYNGTTWSSATLNKNLFTQKEDQSVTVLNGTTTLAARWTWSNAAYNAAKWLAIGHAWSTPASSKTILLQYSSDAGATWRDIHTSTYSDNAQAVYHKIDDNYGEATMRLTITWNSGGTVNLSNIKLLTSRPGDQGRGKEYEYPYTWDADKNITIGGTQLGIKGSSSGTTIIQTAAAASGTLTLPAATDTLVGRATTDTLTNKTLTSPTLTAPVLGTPSSGTLTNCTGLPVSGITASTSTAIGVGSIELGHATDTTIARSAAGVVTIEGIEVVTLSRTQTLTNKTLTSPTFTTPVLGTPSSGTLTSCTGLPVSGITASTSTALGVGSIELGHATDTTIARSSAGVVTIEGVEVVTISRTQTLTNKTLTSPTLTTPVLGTPSSGTLTSCTGLPISSGVSGLGTGVASALGIAVGSAGGFVTNGPVFRAYVDTAQTITSSGTQQKVTFGTETFDSNSNFASSRFTPTVAGYYQLNAAVRISGGSSTGETMLVIWKNGSEYARGTNQSGTEQGVNFYSMQVSDIAVANGSTDYFEIYIQQTSGASKEITAGSNISHFSGCMVRGA